MYGGVWKQELRASQGWEAAAGCLSLGFTGLNGGSKPALRERIPFVSLEGAGNGLWGPQGGGGMKVCVRRGAAGCLQA